MLRPLLALPHLFRWPSAGRHCWQPYGVYRRLTSEKPQQQLPRLLNPPHSPGAEARNKTPARCCLRASESWSPTLPLWCLVAPPFAGKRASHILIRISASFGPSLLVRVNTETPLRGRRRYDMNRTNEKGAPQTGTTTNLLQCRKCRVQVGQQQRQAGVRRTWGSRLPHGSRPRGHLV